MAIPTVPELYPRVCAAVTPLFAPSAPVRVSWARVPGGPEYRPL